jgi:hypothetical protein
VTPALFIAAARKRNPRPVPLPTLPHCDPDHARQEACKQGHCTAYHARVCGASASLRALWTIRHSWRRTKVKHMKQAARGIPAGGDTVKGVVSRGRPATPAHIYATLNRMPGKRWARASNYDAATPCTAESLDVASVAVGSRLTCHQRWGLSSDVAGHHHQPVSCHCHSNLRATEHTTRTDADVKLWMLPPIIPSELNTLAGHTLNWDERSPHQEVASPLSSRAAVVTGMLHALSSTGHAWAPHHHPPLQQTGRRCVRW